MATRDAAVEELSQWLSETYREEMTAEAIVDLLERAGFGPRVAPHVHNTTGWGNEADRPCRVLVNSHRSVRNPWDWRCCGVTAPPGARCNAVAETTTNRTCPKEGVVEMQAMFDGQPVSFLLCGGHFGVHRRRAMTVDLPGGCA